MDGQHKDGAEGEGVITADPLFTFRDGRAVRVGDEAGETHVDGAAEASGHGRGRGEAGDTLPVVELPTHGDHAAPHVLTALFTYEAGVDAWERNKDHEGSLVLIS